LPSDGGPTALRQLAVRRQPEGLQFVEGLPVRPFRDQVRVRNEDPRRVAVGFENRDRLAALDDQSLVIAQTAEGIDDAMERLPVTGCLPRAAVDDELVGLLRVLEVVLE